MTVAAAATSVAAGGIGHASVAAARAALDARGDVVTTVADGWTLRREPPVRGGIEWAFVDPRHPAYPALVRREVMLKAGVATLVTRFLCEGRRAACEALYARVRAHGESAAATTPLPAVAPQ
ncbi:MAG: hypothetical protein RLW62_07845 [Gammaproteobacteria bacterium]